MSSFPLVRRAKLIIIVFDSSLSFDFAVRIKLCTTVNLCLSFIQLGLEYELLELDLVLFLFTVVRVIRTSARSSQERLLFRLFRSLSFWLCSGLSTAGEEIKGAFGLL